MGKINWLGIIKDWFGLVGVLLVAISAIGFSVSAPWPAKADVEAIQRVLEENQAQIKIQQCLLLRLLLSGARSDLEEAENELTEDPNSTRALRDKREAEGQIASIQAQLTAAKCL